MPPDTIAGRAAMRQFDLYDKILATTDEGRQQEMMKEQYFQTA